MRILLYFFLILILAGAGCTRTPSSAPSTEEIERETERAAPAEAFEEAEEEAAEEYFDEPQAEDDEKESAREPVEASPVRTVIIEYLEGGVFAPKEMQISAGTTVIFKNSSTVRVWPASDVHPTHTLCRGFDSLRPLVPGEVYSHTFTEPRVCPFHNHLRASEGGRIVVE